MSFGGLNLASDAELGVWRSEPQGSGVEVSWRSKHEGHNLGSEGRYWRSVFGGGLTLGAKSLGSSPSSQPEQMGFMFHSVCMKEASTWSSPLAVDRC